MSLAQDLETLQRQRAEEVHTLHQTYLRTKRTIIRTASPARILRRHIGLFLIGGAALGLTLAPRPAPRMAEGEAPPPPPPRGKYRLSSSVRWLKKMIAPFAPQFARHIPDLPDDAPPPSAPPPPDEHAETHTSPHRHRHRSHRRLLRTLLTEGATLLLSKIDFAKLFHDLLRTFMPDRYSEQSDDDCDCGNSCACDAPHVSVADVGTVKPTDYENFE